MVTIYTTPTCGFCKAAKEFFNTNDVNYEEKDVTTNPEHQEEMINKSRQRGVPVIDINDTIIVGFDQQKIRSALEANDLL